MVGSSFLEDESVPRVSRPNAAGVPTHYAHVSRCCYEMMTMISAGLSSVGSQLPSSHCEHTPSSVP